MIDISYQTSLHLKIASLLTEYRYSEPLGIMLTRINQSEASYLYKLCINKKRDELKQFIEAHI